MREQDFEVVLHEQISHLPPNDAIVRAVTPWRTCFGRILWGLGLTSITLNFFCLQYLLPAIGILLLLLGFRTLRKENGWFRACFGLSCVRAVYFLFISLVDATIFHTKFTDSQWAVWLTAANIFCVFLQYFCFWRALRRTVSAADSTQSTGSSAALLIWYALITFFALLPIGGLVVVIALLVVYVCILISLREVSRSLDCAGYAIRPTRIVVSDRLFALLALLIAAIGLSTATLLATDYPMVFSPISQHVPPTQTELSTQLTTLGFPADLLGDLTEDDLAELALAEEVLVSRNYYPVNKGRDVFSRSTGSDNVITIHRQTVYDERELQITAIAVRMSGETERWMLIHHFSWVCDPGFWGTEAMQFWTADRSPNQGWTSDGTFSGQVLCEVNGQTVAAPYAFLGRVEYTASSMFFGNSAENDLFAEFSFPRNSSHQRGYVAYTVEELEEGWIVDSWMNYIHQTSPWQYPFKTAAEHKRQGGWSHDGAFCVVQTALQFFSDSGLIQ